MALQTGETDTAAVRFEHSIRERPTGASGFLA